MRARVRGCLLGGAVGDALGAAIEFHGLEAIRASHGPDGPSDYAPAYGLVGAITDDTQMTLFTLEGLLRGEVQQRTHGKADFAALIGEAYGHWLSTQDARRTAPKAFSYLAAIPALHSARAPGTTCIGALSKRKSRSEQVDNDSKGCGGVMRVAPIGLFFATKDDGAAALDACFALAVAAAGLTHGHPTGKLASGVFAGLVQRLTEGASLERALYDVKQILVRHASHAETLAAIDEAERAAAQGRPTPEGIEKLGGGWIAEEALAIAIYCALAATSFEQAVRLAVTHSGDSDSTGSMVGQLLGAQLGESAIPARWAERVELGWLVRELADDLCDRSSWWIEPGVRPTIATKYPCD